MVVISPSSTCLILQTLISCPVQKHDEHNNLFTVSCYNNKKAKPKIFKDTLIYIRSLSYRWTQEIAKHERSTRCCIGLWRLILECSANLPSTSITWEMHNLNLWPFLFHDMIKVDILPWDSLVSHQERSFSLSTF